MKKGVDLGLVPIKCENKTGTESLKTIHHRINSILYSNTYRYIDQALAIEMYRNLCGLGKELGELEVPDAAKPKKGEILEALRKCCLALKDYRKIPNTVEDAPDIQKNIGWWLHEYITAKNEGKFDKNPDLALEYVKESKRLYDVAFPFAEHIKLDTLTKGNQELLGMINSKYSIIQ